VSADAVQAVPLVHVTARPPVPSTSELPITLTVPKATGVVLAVQFAETVALTSRFEEAVEAKAGETIADAARMAAMAEIHRIAAAPGLRMLRSCV
jgi:hypothetical protein